MSRPSVQVARFADQLPGVTLEAVIELCHEAVRQRGKFTMALSGGSTPRRLYELMAQEQGLPFDKMHFFFGDERHVPPDSKDSNFRMAKEALFSRAPIPTANIHRIQAELPDVQDAAARYEQTLREAFKPVGAQVPRLDLVLLGLGVEGHTASLFPHTPAIGEKKRWVMGQWIEPLKTDRITLTPPVINAARAVMFLVQGEDKADAVKSVLEGKESPELVPAKIVQPEPGGLWWFLDSNAAAKLKSSTVTSNT
jgi:6-phosphogluconolactonase